VVSPRICTRGDHRDGGENKHIRFVEGGAEAVGEPVKSTTRQYNVSATDSPRFHQVLTQFGTVAIQPLGVPPLGHVSGEEV